MSSQRFSVKSLTCLILLLLTTQSALSSAAADDILSSPGLKLIEPAIPERITGATRALNEQFSKGVSPEKNAVVYLVQLFGSSVFDEAIRDDSLKMLGIATLDREQPRMIYMGEFAQKQHPESKTSQAALLEKFAIEFHDAGGKPWKKEDFPVVATYIEFNKDQFDRLVKIANLPAYYAPALSVDNPQSLLSASFALEYRLPYMGQCLSARALYRLGEGDFAGAMSDLIAVHKLALLLANGSPLDVSVAKAHWVDSHAFRAELEILKSGILTAEQASQYMKALSQLPKLPKPSVSADVGERLTIRQEIELLRDDDESMNGFFDWDPTSNANELSKLRAAKINWDLAIKRADEVQDEAVACLSLTDHDAQMKEINRLNEEAIRWTESTDQDDIKLFEILSKDKDAASKWLGESIARSLRTNIWQRINTDNRGTVRRDFIIIGLALTEYRKQKNTYPENLEDLTPGILTPIPLDTHTGEAFHYQKLTDGKAQLSSWGPDRVSNAELWPSDDLVLELPE